MIKRILSALICISMIGLDTFAISDSPNDVLHIEYKENDGAFHNPGKGWVISAWSHESVENLSEDIWQYVDNVGTKVSWHRLEPEEGQYDWEIFDRYIRSAEKHECAFIPSYFTLEVTAGYPTPKWVFDAGAKGVEALSGWVGTGTRDSGGLNVLTVPDYSDPIFIEKNRNFIKAFAERYNNDERIYGVYMTNAGTFGEGGYARTFVKDEPLPVFPSYEFVAENLYAPYIEYFDKTKLFYPRVYGQDWAAENGYGILKADFMQSDFGNMIGGVAKGKVPVIAEVFDWEVFEREAEFTVGPKHWDDKFLTELRRCSGSMVLLNIHDIESENGFVNKHKELLEYVSKYIGYRFYLKNMEIPSAFKNGDSVPIRFEVANRGTSKIHQNSFVKIALIDKSGKVVADHLLENVDPNAWYGETVTTVDTSVAFDDVSGGEYRLAIGFFSEKNLDTPRYRIANFDSTENETGEKYYILADVDVNNGEYKVSKHLSDENITVYSGDGKVETGIVRTVNGAQMVPVRKICESLGINVEYDEKSDTVKLSKNALEYTISNNSTIASGSEENVVLSNKIVDIDGKAYIAIVDLCKLFGVKATFDDQNRNLSLELEDTNLINKKPYQDRFNTIVNTAFEEDTNAWSIDTEAFQYDEETGVENSRSLKAVNIEKKKAASQCFGVEYDKQYKITFKSKGTGKLRARVYDNWECSIDAICTEPSEDWVENELYFIIPKEAYRDRKDNYARFVFETVSKDGSVVYVDDVNLCIDSEKNTNELNADGVELVKNGNAENEGRYWGNRQDGKPGWTDELSHSGVGCFYLDIGHTQWGQLIQFITNDAKKLGPGKYLFRGWFRSKNPDAELALMMFRSVAVSVGDSSKGLVYSTDYKISSDEWTYIEREIDLDWPLSGEEPGDWEAVVGVQVSKQAAGNFIYMDDVSLKKID